MTVPNNFTKGITLKWSASYTDYPASTWTLVYTFVNPDSQHQITAAANVDDFAITASMAQTSAFSVGRYDWQATVTDGTEKYLVGEGTTCVIEDFAATTGHDGRSQLAATVDAINAYLLGNATNEQETRKFNGREIKNHPRTDLMIIRSQLKTELKQEQKVKLFNEGLPSGSKIRVVF